METSTIVQALGVIAVLFNSLVSANNFYNLRRNDSEQKSQWDAIDLRALKNDVIDIKEDLKEDIKDSEARCNLRISEISVTIQTAKADIISNIDRLVSALTHK